MQNAEVFEQYGSEKWVIEQNLCFLLQGFWEQCYKKGYVKESHCPLNPVGVVKEFMKEETIVDTPWAEKSKMYHNENTLVVDAEFKELGDNDNAMD